MQVYNITAMYTVFKLITGVLAREKVRVYRLVNLKYNAFNLILNLAGELNGQSTNWSFDL